MTTERIAAKRVPSGWGRPRTLVFKTVEQVRRAFRGKARRRRAGR